ncbi:gamma tubulin complex subunit Mod21 [Schizosaccharomyces japonicus yFS275]|uniref:Gamma tubulin complex subunit Mod21 n=1 Tax=Schizosaccharomyces japonicus (strain yFS275 / FY16936) TaxID=402676 RepID=B6K1F8_SCHJY|nr:gamma tubulin complex subunit Mod21 [Schizosaccharomyces japonicus yFS275]EEB07779.1 gamma tubulin complex subunit Mod21 [Schizosaccharomyces japonicus yFS275]
MSEVDLILEQLVSLVFSNESSLKQKERYLLYKKYVKNTNAPSITYNQVISSVEGIAEKQSILGREDVANCLHARLAELDQVSSNWRVKLGIANVLHLLLTLSAHPRDVVWPKEEQEEDISDELASEKLINQDDTYLSAPFEGEHWDIPNWESSDSDTSVTFYEETPPVIPDNENIQDPQYYPHAKVSEHTEDYAYQQYEDPVSHASETLLQRILEKESSGTPQLLQLSQQSMLYEIIYMLMGYQGHIFTCVEGVFRPAPFDYFQIQGLSTSMQEHILSNFCNWGRELHILNRVASTKHCRFLPSSPSDIERLPPFIFQIMTVWMNETVQNELLRMELLVRKHAYNILKLEHDVTDLIVFVELLTKRLISGCTSVDEFLHCIFNIHIGRRSNSLHFGEFFSKLYYETLSTFLNISKIDAGYALPTPLLYIIKTSQRVNRQAAKSLLKQTSEKYFAESCSESQAPSFLVFVLRYQQALYELTTIQETEKQSDLTVQDTSQLSAGSFSLELSDTLQSYTLRFKEAYLALNQKKANKYVYGHLVFMKTVYDFLLLLSWECSSGGVSIFLKDILTKRVLDLFNAALSCVHTDSLADVLKTSVSNANDNDRAVPTSEDCNSPCIMTYLAHILIHPSQPIALEAFHYRSTLSKGIMNTMPLRSYAVNMCIDEFNSFS